MEIMQQSANHLDGRWRSHVLPPYTSGHTLSSLPNLHDHIRQQMISQSDQQPLQHTSTSNDHLQQQQQQHLHSQQQHSQQQQLPPHHMPSHRLDPQLHQHSRQVIVEHQQRRDPSSLSSPSKEHQQPLISSSSSNRGGGGRGASASSLPSPSLQLNNLTIQSSPSSASPSTPPTPSPSTPSPGKSGGKDGEEKKGEEWEQYNAGAAFLGPTLWDKTLSYDSDLKVSLEYMDLDEFLNENGIPIDESKRAAAAAAAAANNGTGGGSNSNVAMANANSLRAAQLSPEAPSSPEMSPSQMGSGMGACPQGAGASASSMAAAPTTSGGTVLPPDLSPQDYGDCSSSISSPGSPDPHSPFQGHEPVPGQDFDPRTRCFSEEELKPQPMIKKSRKQFVPVEMKDDKYWARRRKNNMAAKRSRDARRLKENQIAMRANFLEKENNAMTVELQKAQAIVESLKKRLAMYEAV